MVAIVNTVMTAASSVWASVLLAQGALLAGLARLAVAAASAAGLLLLRRGTLRLTGRLSVSVCLAFLVYIAVWLNTPTPEVEATALPSLPSVPA